MIAVIDLGSNLTKLVIAKNALPLQVVHKSVYNTKTLKNAPMGHFDHAAISKIKSDIAEILKVCHSYNCSTVLGIATSAFRTRSNGQEVINEINAELGTQIQIISGNQEAAYIFNGAITHQALAKTDTCIIMDIGGGSTEFIIGQNNQILWKHSFELGSTALSKGLQLASPLTRDNVATLEQRLENILPALWEAITTYGPTHLIGTTGAFESLALIIEGTVQNPITPQSGYTFDMEKVMPVLEQLISSSPEERKNIKGIHPMREDTIAIAALILFHVLRNSQFANFTLSLEDVKEGLILQHLHNTPA